MDLKQKGISWVSNFCHQIEEVCHEVEDIVAKHGIKYVGNQIQNVRDSGKRMYCDVVEDLLPPLENCAEEELGREESSKSNVSDDDSSRETCDASIEQDSSAIVENGIKLFLEEREEWEGDTVSEAFDGVNYDAWGILTDFSLETCDVNQNSESSQIEVAGDECVSDHAQSTEPLCLKSLLVSETPSAKSSGSYVNPFEIESCKNNIAGFGRSNSETSMASQAGLASCGSQKSRVLQLDPALEPNEMMPLNSSSEIWLGQMTPPQNRTFISLSSLDGSLVSSLESSMEEIQLNDEAEHEESCVVVDENELYSLLRRLQRGSYKKRIREFFGGKKRVVKEYEQLGIWFGDADMDNSEGTSPTLKPLRFRTSLDSKNLEASETEWEML